MPFYRDLWQNSELFWPDLVGNSSQTSASRLRRGRIAPASWPHPATTSVANAGRFRYTGQMYFPEYGLYSYKARFYSPTLGRFMQADPVGYGDGVNLYNYVGGDPVNFRDPTGLAKDDIIVTGRRSHQNAPPALGGGRLGGVGGSSTNERGDIACDAACLAIEEIVVTANKTKPAPPLPPAGARPQETQPSLADKIADKSKEILCSETTGQIADAVAGVVTGGATSGAIKFANARYAAAVGGEIGSIVGRRAILIAAGPEAAIAVGVAFVTAQGVKYARGKFCPAGK